TGSILFRLPPSGCVFSEPELTQERGLVDRPRSPLALGASCSPLLPNRRRPTARKVVPPPAHDTPDAGKRSTSCWQVEFPPGRHAPADTGGIALAKAPPDLATSNWFRHKGVDTPETGNRDSGTLPRLTTCSRSTLRAVGA